MNWYYKQGDEQGGPVDDGAFRQMVVDGVITADTPVRSEDMPDWLAYREVWAESAAKAGEVPSPSLVRCSECGGMFPEDETIRHDSIFICALCKPVFIQKLRQGVPIASMRRYAGFWIRFVAKFIDSVIVGTVNMLLGFLVMALAAATFEMEQGGFIAVIVAQFVVIFARIGLDAAFKIWFVGKYSATPGKMACGLRIIMADGGSVSYGRATGRFFAEWLSAMTLGIGYIMAGFDPEKRSLHDRVCQTRVVFR